MYKYMYLKTLDLLETLVSTKKKLDMSLQKIISKPWYYLSEKEKIFLIDGYYSFIHFYNNKKYIPLDLCFIILKYLKNIIIFDFIIIFVKYEKNDINELLIYDIKSKNKNVINNNIWKRNEHTSYCFHETKDD